MSETYPLFGRICIIKPDDQLALVHLGEILIE